MFGIQQMINFPAVSWNPIELANGNLAVFRGEFRGEGVRRARLPLSSWKFVL